MKLSDFELQVMQVFWQRGELTAPEVHQIITEEHQVAYTTVKTIIDRLEKKTALERARTYGRTIVYKAIVAKDQLSRPMVKDFIQKLFSGNVRPMFNHLIKEESLSIDDVDYLQKVLAEKRKDLQDESEASS